MGDHSQNIHSIASNRAVFIRHLLDDIKALERMHEENLIEDNIVRIGAEQEFCLVNAQWRPSVNAIPILEKIDDPHFTTELARYNLEINLDPVELQGECFGYLEERLIQHLLKARAAALEFDERIILTGILPTISKNELELDYMTPNPRYKSLNDQMRALKGSDFELRIRGIDELSVKHDSVLFEACNTSFQMHLQIAPQDFVSSYNWAQAIAGPVLGICANSPILLGRELWSETRIALFQQSIDTRNSSYALRDQQARVTFGNEWAEGLATDIFKNNLAEYKILIAREVKTNSLDELDQGRIPSLDALNLNNSTLYHWNRACYGVGGGKPHLRIENRYIPSGPTVLDEVANFAFWAGLMQGRPKAFDYMPEAMEFRDAKSNFIKAARTGKESVMRWCGERYSLRDLILKVLLPIARIGLEKSAISKGDIEKYLGVIERRTKSQTGAQWQIRNFRKLKENLKTDDALLALAKSMYKNQRSGYAAHEWPDIDPELRTHEAATNVGHIMDTALFSVNENDLADLATSIMEWKNIHHLPVENDQGLLVGILTWTHVQRFKQKGGEIDNRLVKDIMVNDVILAHPKDSITSTISLMKRREIGCVPVSLDGQLVGIITIADVKPFDIDQAT